MGALLKLVQDLLAFVSPQILRYNVNVYQIVEAFNCSLYNLLVF